MGHSIAEVVDRLDPIDVGRQEPELRSVECSTVVFSWISAFGQSLCSVASEGHCISCGKTFRADTLDRCFIRLKQNLSFVIIPLKTDSTEGEMSRCEKIIAGSAREMLPVFSPY